MEQGIWIVTDAAGSVMECSASALQLLGYSARGARGRQLTNLFVEERPRLAELLDVARGGIVERTARLRPNDRRPVEVAFRIERLQRDTDTALLSWTFDVRWPVALRVPRGLDRRQLITVWRSGELRCVFVPGGCDGRRLLVCERDEVVLEEAPSDCASALARAAELLHLAESGELQ